MSGEKFLAVLHEHGPEDGREVLVSRALLTGELRLPIRPVMTALFRGEDVDLAELARGPEVARYRWDLTVREDGAYRFRRVVER